MGLERASVNSSAGEDSSEPEAREGIPAEERSADAPESPLPLDPPADAPVPEHPSAPASPAAVTEAPSTEVTPAAKKKTPPPRKWKRDPALAMAFRKGVPIEGKVEQVIKGVYEVRVGKARGFCPHSQLELRHVDTPEQYVGTTLSFKVLQLRRGGEEAILSRRALLEERLVDERKAVWATLLEGAVNRPSR
jgi:hypothetical protein